MGDRVRMGRKAGLLALLGMLATFPAAAQNVRMVLATTPKYTDEIRAVDGTLVADHPGHHAELMQAAASRCGASVEFRFVPWQRALLEVRNGDADGAFSSSYSAERAGFGAYPLTAEGKPDSGRALKGYSYSLYVRRDSGLTWDGQTIPWDNKAVVAERGASVLPRLRELGLAPVEIADNATMLRMVAAGDRVAAAALMTEAAEAILAAAPDLRATVTRLETPLEDKFGYVMLSRPFHDRNPALAECFWSAIRAIRATPDYAEMVRAYRAETP